MRNSEPSHRNTEGSSAGAGGDGGAEKGEDEDDAPLLSVSAASNALNMVLRGPGVLRFVKYLRRGVGYSPYASHMIIDRSMPCALAHCFFCEPGADTYKLCDTVHY